MACLAATVLFCAAGCRNWSSPDTTNHVSSQQAPPGQNNANDPANANLAPVSNSTDNTGEPAGAEATVSQESSQYKTYSNYQDPYANQPSSFADYDNYSEYESPVAFSPQPPPAMPDAQQPPCPGDNYIWTPGHWGYQNGQGFYWVPGAWAMAPYAGALWTPGWWGYLNGRYAWHRGYWGRHIGFYGGIRYGNGYDGFGYQGGYWKGDQFQYNRSDNNVNTGTVHNLYDYRAKIYNTSRVSYNGGPGGIYARPRPEEVEALHEEHYPPMQAQVQLAQQAQSDRQNFAGASQGRPQMMVASQPLAADKNVPAPQPVRYSPPLPRTGVYPWQAGALPSAEMPNHDVGPERVVARTVSGAQPPQGRAPETQMPEARGGPEHGRESHPAPADRRPDNRPAAEHH